MTGMTDDHSKFPDLNLESSSLFTNCLRCSSSTVSGAQLVFLLRLKIHRYKMVLS